MEINYKFNFESRDDFDFSEYQNFKHAPVMARVIHDIHDKINSCLKEDREAIPVEEIKRTFGEILRENRLSIIDISYRF